MEKDLSGKRLIPPVVRLHFKTVSRPNDVLQTHKLYLPLLVPAVVAVGQLIKNGLEYSCARLLPSVGYQGYTPESFQIQPERRSYPTKLFVGIDVSSQKLDVCFMDSEDNILHEAALLNVSVKYTYLFSPLIGLEKILSSAIIQVRGKFHDKKRLHTRVQRTDIKECQEVGNVSLVARQHNISANTIHTWRRKTRKTGSTKTLPADDAKRIKELKARLEKIGTENDRLKRIVAEKELHYY